jgi:hypothetical protein
MIRSKFVNCSVLSMFCKIYWLQNATLITYKVVSTSHHPSQRRVAQQATAALTKMERGALRIVCAFFVVG